ncbi:aminoacyltransferase [Streptococcus phocae subsp. salmonis]|uniref:aminoacyltransferase n=1 Tax=Streptococcus phocae TaxID=119224 RepID=UPI000531B08D|nr:aminoacyltransferase [Streptococcus phocae]KGR72996.1 peptidoglycan branched peptide synthesis protein [Streptococcus phocae subsp. salmonis]
MGFVTLNQQEFDAFAQTIERRYFEQSSSMSELLTKRGYQTELLGYQDDQGQLQVGALLFSAPVFGGKLLTIHYGPIYHDPAYLLPFLTALKAYAKKAKAIELVVKPYTNFDRLDDHGNQESLADDTLINLFKELGFQHTKPQPGSSQYDWHYVKDLTGITESNLLASFSKKGKALVKKANTFGIKIKALNRDELNLFKKVTASTSERRNYNDKPLEYYEYLFDSFKEQATFLVAALNFKDYYANLEKDQNQLKQKLDKLEADVIRNPNSEKKKNQLKEFSSQYQTFEVRKKEARTFIEKYNDQDVILAGSLFIFTPQEVVYFFSGSYVEFNKFYAPAVLQEHIMTEAIKRGITRYNLLGISGFFDGSDGVLGFKQNFNGHIERLCGTFTYHPNPLKYKLIEGTKKLLGRY